MSVRSMTGFSRVRRSSEEGEVTLTLKSVNHRGLDMHFHMPDELAPFESGLRAVLKQSVVRGHVQVRVSFAPSRPSAMILNHALLDTWVAAYRQIAAQLGLPGDPDLNAALALPGMFSDPDAGESREPVGRLLVEAMEEAARALNAFREREGRELASEMAARASAIRGAAARLEAFRSQVVSAFQTRLTERLGELLATAPLEPQRLVQEVAVLVDRSDISEELSRLKAHVAQLEKLLGDGGEIGKKLDFLLQEMAREANTILSKSNGAGELGLAITEQGLSVKAEIEKIREQALNLE